MPYASMLLSAYNTQTDAWAEVPCNYQELHYQTMGGPDILHAYFSATSLEQLQKILLEQPPAACATLGSEPSSL